MFKVGICGHFGLRKELFNGQTIKTKMLTSALEAELGKKDIVKIDTHGGMKALPKVFLQLLVSFIECQTVIMLPAHNGIKIFAPFLAIFGKLLHCQILYVVIGGWLPEMTKNKKWLAYFLKKFNGIYVETSSMKAALETQGFTNIFVMPNFKNLSVLSEKELVYTTHEPFSFCMFSRVMKEKGIEDAINAITQINNQAGRTVATLDIYGQIDSDYISQFNKLQHNFPSFIKYKGIISPDKSVETLKNYFALLFPTHFATEGIPGTLIDAYSAGVPVITALWNNYLDIFIEGQTGYGFELDNFPQFITCMKKVLETPVEFNNMKPLCLQEAQKYMPQQAIQVLLENVR